MPLKCEKLRTLSSLSSNFSDLKVIAGGGGGVVLSGVDKSLSVTSIPDKENSAVALKRLSLVGKGHCRVALRELRLLKRFKHENLVKTLKITDSSGTAIEDPSMENFKDLDAVYVVEELLDTDLHKVIERNGKLSLETCKLFLYQLLRGLKYIHSANVVHRDIKPGNMFVKADDLTLKIGDYGLARVFDKRYDHKGYLTAVVSTRYYRAPEVMINLGNYSYPIDIWSAGCVFGEMLLGKVMFPGKNDLDQINVICESFGLNIESFYEQEASFPEHIFDGLPPEVIDLLNKMLRINPSERLTAEEALKHPFFSELHDPQDEPICEQPFFVEHEIDNLPLKILKRKILRNSCLHVFEKKSYHSSEESLFKDFDETFTSDMISLTINPSPSDVRLNSRGEETDSSDHHSSNANTSIESCISYSKDICLPSLRDAMSREEILDEPYRDPGVCERKYHENNNEIPSIDIYTSNDSYNCIQQETSYFSGLSPVIDITEPAFPTQLNTPQHFLGIHGRYCANKNNDIITCPNGKDKKSLKCLNDEILKSLNSKIPSENCKLEDLMSAKLSKNPPTLSHWDSLRFWI